MSPIPQFNSTNYLTLIRRSYSIKIRYQTFSDLIIVRNPIFGPLASGLIRQKKPSTVPTSKEATHSCISWLTWPPSAEGGNGESRLPCRFRLIPTPGGAGRGLTSGPWFAIMVFMVSLSSGDTTLIYTCRHCSMVMTVSDGSCTLFGNSFSSVTPISWGQRRFRKLAVANANSSCNAIQKVTKTECY